MCLGKVWGVKQLCLSVFHIADSIGSGRWRHGRNSLEREILSYVYAANGSEGKKEGEEKQLKNDTNRNILGQQATNSTAPRSSNRDNVRKTLLMGITTKVLVGFKRSEGRRLWTISMRMRSKAGINFTPGMAYPYEVINFILSRPRPNISAITISWTAPKKRMFEWSKFWPKILHTEELMVFRQWPGNCLPTEFTVDTCAPFHSALCGQLFNQKRQLCRAFFSNIVNNSDYTKKKLQAGENFRSNGS